MSAGIEQGDSGGEVLASWIELQSQPPEVRLVCQRDLVQRVAVGTPRGTEGAGNDLYRATGHSEVNGIVDRPAQGGDGKL